MQLKGLVTSVLLASVVSARKDDNSTGTSIKSQCKSVAKMQNLVELAANQTKLDSKTDGNTTLEDEIKSKAAEATTQLSTLTSNTTLMDQCAVIQAHADSVESCSDMQKLEKQIATASNDTKLQDKFEGNTTEIDAFQAKTAEWQSKLAALQGNSSLTTFCAAQQSVDDCKSMSQLQKVVDMAGNDTALQAKFDGNATKIDKFKTKAAEAQTKLDALMGNSTLMDTCSSLSQAETDGTAKDTSDDSSGTSSAAARLEMVRQVVGAGLVVFLGGIFML
ncbi:hypothetical protein F4778DRAFT_499480 [Xylariomycetidae sp. FL2044]|nr:hypothetical protein F4778DRAFT_499480 [Xylariomycetidae sp. FL2044]